METNEATPDDEDGRFDIFFVLRLGTGGSVHLRRAVNALAEWTSESLIGFISPTQVALFSSVGSGPPRLLAVMAILDSEEDNPLPSVTIACQDRRFFDVSFASLMRCLKETEEGDTLEIVFSEGIYSVLVSFLTWNSARWGMFPPLDLTEFEVYDDDKVQSRLQEVIEQLGSIASSFPTNHHRTSIGIPADVLIQLLVYLHLFSDSVSVRATDTEVKFSAANEFWVYKTEHEECFIKGVSPGHPISFTFSLHSLEGILNTCVLSNIVWFHYLPDRDHPMMQCTVGQIGHITLYPDCFTQI